MEQDFIVIGIWLLALCGIGIQMRISAKGREKKFEKKLRKNFGARPQKEYEYEAFESISHYFRNVTKGRTDVIDDITWNDLDMDTIFMLFDHTNSSAGAEYLYYLLRTPVLSQEKLSERELLIQYFSAHEEERVKLQKIFAKIGRTRKHSITDYIYNLNGLQEKSNLEHYILCALFFCSIGILIVNPVIGVLIFIAAMTINTCVYFKRKAEVEPYVVSFSYLLRILKGVQEIEKLQISELQTYVSKMKESGRKFKKFQKNSYIVSTMGGIGGSLGDVILDYLRMVLHVDLIKFNSMLRELKKNIDEVEIFIEGLGLIESMICVASFREMISYYCIPQLTDKKEAFVEIKEVYHPMIEEPVTNSISENSSVLITGSNASGKSTFLKTAAINAILSQAVNTSLSKEYKANFFRVYSSMALQDDLIGKDSYYMVEIKSLKRIMDAGKDEIPMLCFVDEVLRGTNTVERIAASAQILENLNRPHVFCFAATHDIELTHILEHSYKNYHFREEIKNGDILFNYCLYEGRAQTRNAIKLLGMMGYKPEIIKSAELSAEHFIETGEWKL